VRALRERGWRVVNCDTVVVAQVPRLAPYRAAMRANLARALGAAAYLQKLDALEDFHPERIAGRILGMGDVVGLVEVVSRTQADPRENVK